MTLAARIRPLIDASVSTRACGPPSHLSAANPQAPSVRPMRPAMADRTKPSAMICFT